MGAVTAEVASSSLVAPAILSKGVIGRNAENSNPQPNPQLFSSPSYSSPQPLGIRPVRLVFHRCLPACIDRASSEPWHDARFPARSWARLSPCSLASCLSCDAGCEVRTFARPRYALRLSLLPVADGRRRIQKSSAVSFRGLSTTETQSRFHWGDGLLEFMTAGIVICKAEEPQRVKRFKAFVMEPDCGCA